MKNQIHDNILDWWEEDHRQAIIAKYKSTYAAKESKKFPKWTQLVK